MSRDEFTRRVRGLPFGLLGAMALVMAVERTLPRYELELSDFTSLNWSYSRRAAKSEAPKADILLFGASAIKFGLLPRSVESATGRPTYNLAVANSQMPSSYYLLKRSLDSGARPAAIVIDCLDSPISPGDWGRRQETFRLNVRNWPELLDLGETVDLAWQARDVDFLVTTVVCWVLPSYKLRFEIRNLVGAAIQGKDGSQWGKSLVFLRNWNANLGANVMPASATLKENEFPPPRLCVTPPEVFGDGRWRRNSLSERYTRRLLTLAAAHKIPVFWVLPPVTPLGIATRWNTGLDRYFEDRARAAQETSPGVTVLNAARALYPPDAFSDKVHLNAKGAIAFSEDVASAMADVFSGRAPASGWVVLPDYADHDSWTPTEDVDESWVAFWNGRVGRR